MKNVQKRKLKRTNSKQFECLVEEMAKYPDLAKGCAKFGISKQYSRIIWEEIAKKLNNLGPPIRNWKEWQKVWIDYKGGVRKKIIAHRKKITATTGVSSFESVRFVSALKQSVDAILKHEEAPDLEAQQNQPSTSTELSDREQPSTSSGLSHRNQASTAPNRGADVNTGNAENVVYGLVESKEKKPDMAPTNFSRKRIAECGLNMLESQTETQSAILETLKKIEQNTYENSKTLHEICEIKKEKLKLLKQKFQQEKEDSSERNKVRLVEMKTKKRKLELIEQWFPTFLSRLPVRKRK